MILYAVYVVVTLLSAVVVAFVGVWLLYKDWENGGWG